MRSSWSWASAQTNPLLNIYPTILKEQTPNEDAYYCALSNRFDSILIQEELVGEVLSIAVFDVNQIQILNIEEL